MSDAIVGTVIGVVGTGMIGMFFMQFQNLRDDLKQGFRDQGPSIKSLETAVVQLQGAVGQLQGAVGQLNKTAKDHGERLTQIEETAKDHDKRLARIEVKLDTDPPAEAA